MRKLTVKQKKLLDKHWEEYQPRTYQDLQPWHWEEIEKINDTEILWQEVNRYLGDK